MSHRIADRERVRRAHADYLDSETADRVMSREYRSAVPRDRGAWEAPREADPAAVARLAHDIAHDAAVPDALALPCPEHDAAPGVYCYRGARGVCGARFDGRHRHV